MKYKYASADPEYVLEITGFYWDTMINNPGIGTKIKEVALKAKEHGLPQVDIANAIIRIVSATPPRFTSFNSVKKYFLDNVLSGISSTTRYDDVFWCCLLAGLDNTNIPECILGGPIHKMVLKVHDDFHPEDISL